MRKNLRVTKNRWLVTQVAVAENIPVKGVAPPMHVRLISLTYFTGIVVIGLLLGLWLRQGRTQRTGLTWNRSVS